MANMSFQVGLAVTRHLRITEPWKPHSGEQDWSVFGGKGGKGDGGIHSCSATFFLCCAVALAADVYRSAELQRAVNLRGEIAIGICQAESALRGGVQLNPQWRQRLDPSAGDELIVLT